MADDITVTPGTGATIAADDVGGKLHQRVKVSVGADGVAADWTGAVSVSNLPADPTTGTVLAAVAASVDGVEAKLDTLAGYVDAVETKQDTIITALADLLTELGQKLETGGAVVASASDLDIRFLQRDGDAVAVAHQTDRMMEGATALTPKFATIAASSSGNNQIVAAVASKKIRVLSYVLVAAGTVAVKWRSASTDKTGAMPFVANTGVSVNFSPVGHLETVANEALNLNLDGAVSVAGSVVYVEVS